MARKRRKNNETRLEKLKNLESDLLVRMDEAESREYAALARQYRETLREIDILEGGDTDDEVASIILRHRKSNSD